MKNDSACKLIAARFALSTVLLMFYSGAIAQPSLGSTLDLQDHPKWTLIPVDIRAENIGLHPRSILAKLREEAQFSVFFDLMFSNMTLRDWDSVASGDALPDDEQALYLVSPTLQQSAKGEFFGTAILMDDQQNQLRIIDVSSPAEKGIEHFISVFWNSIDQPLPVRKIKYSSRPRKNQRLKAVTPHSALRPDGNYGVLHRQSANGTGEVTILPVNHTQFTSPLIDTFPIRVISWGEGATGGRFAVVTQDEGAVRSVEHQLPDLNEGMLPATMSIKDIKFVKVRDYPPGVDQNMLDREFRHMQEGKMDIDYFIRYANAFAAKHNTSKQHAHGMIQNRVTAVFMHSSPSLRLAESSLYFATFDIGMQCKGDVSCDRDTGTLQWIQIAGLGNNQMTDLLGESWTRNARVRLDNEANYWAVSPEHGASITVFHNSGLRYATGQGHWQPRGTEQVAAGSHVRSGAVNWTKEDLRSILRTSNSRHTAYLVPARDDGRALDVHSYPADSTPSPTPEKLTEFLRVGWKVVDFDFSPDGRSIGIIWEQAKADGTTDQEVQLWDFRSDNIRVSFKKPRARFLSERATVLPVSARNVSSKHERLVDLSFSAAPLNYLYTEKVMGHNNFLILNAANDGYEVHRFGVRLKPRRLAVEEKTMISNLFVKKTGQPSVLRGEMITPVFIDYSNNLLIEGKEVVVVNELYPVSESERILLGETQ